MTSEQALRPATFPRQRRWQRYDFECPLRLVVQKPAGRIEIRTQATAINEGGMLLKLAAVDLHIGERVLVEVAPTYSGVPVRVNAEVRSRSNNSYGVQFLGSESEGPHGVTLLRQLIRSAAGCWG